MLELTGISKDYGAFRLQDITLEVPDGSYYVMLGPSGAGKTQILEIITGLMKADAGSLKADGLEMTGMESRHRPIGIVFQDLAVFPHLNVERNIAFGLRGKGLISNEIMQKVMEQASRMNIEGLLGRMPGHLSGGELQRVALARTLIRQPRYLLLDEPLSSLDVQLRQEMFGLLKKIHREGQTILHVTHDYEETMVLATHVAVVNQGRIVQNGTVGEVFHHPRSEFVARFTGIKNYFPAAISEASQPVVAKLANGVGIRVSSDEKPGKGYVMIPGEEIILSNHKVETSAANQFKGHVLEVFNIPGGMEVLVDASIPLFVKVTGESLDNLQLTPGKETWVSFKASGVRFIRMDY